ncbi:MAG: ADOP family duplicated permease [Gemmatimonadota bacterium]
MSPDPEPLRGAGGSVWRRFRRLFRHDAATDVEAELAFHLEMRAADYRARGLPPDAATRAASERFGDFHSVRRECDQLMTRQARWRERLERVSEVGQDLRWAVRGLVRAPGFAFTAALALALGIAATLAVWAMVSSYLFRPLPLRNADRLVVIAQTSGGHSTPGGVSYPNYLDIAGQRALFSDVVVYDNALLNVRIGSGEPTVRLYEVTSGNYFAAFRVPLLFGRGYTDQEFADRTPVVVLSYSAWQSRFSASPAVLGSVVQFNGVPFTVIGVAARGYGGMRQSLLPVDGFVPLTSALLLDSRGDASLREREQSSYRVAALLAPGATLASARAGLRILGDRIAQEHPRESNALGFVVEKETHSRPDIAVAGVIPWAAAVFLVLTGLVLLVGCTNVAGLLFARASARRGEIAIRRALGASTGRMVQMVFAEGALLALLGLLLAAPLTIFLLRWFSGIRMATDFPVRFTVTAGWELVPPAVLIGLIAAIGVSITPAWHAARLPVQETLKDGGRGGSGGRNRRRLRTTLVGAQVAVSFVLLVCAALFTRSLGAAQRLDLGFRTPGLVMGTTDVEVLRYDRNRGVQFQQELLRRARELPGVQSAAFSVDVPLGYDNSSLDLFFDRDVGVRDNRVDTYYNVVSPGYFGTMGYPLLDGRDFSDRDDSTAAPVVVVNQELANRYWPGISAVGRRVRFTEDGPWATVVGVVGSGRYVFLNEAPRPYAYLPWGQRYRTRSTLELRAPGAEAATLASIRRLVHDLDPDMPIADLRSMEAHLQGGIAFLFPRLAAIAAMAIGLLGLLQAVVGLYGVIAYSVAERTREIGIRMAIGARPQAVVRGILFEGIRLTATGMAVGLAGAFVATRLMRAVLLGVGPSDPLSYIGAASVLLLVTTLAAWLPARRAARLDPVAALRSDA